MNKFFWLKIYILAAILISLSFLGVNLLAQVPTETGGDIIGYIRECQKLSTEADCKAVASCAWQDNKCARKCPDFTDMNSLTMKDNCTGLVWSRFELPTYHGATEPGYTWQEAKDACAAFMKPGLFRLPTVEELLSLISYKCEGGTCSSGLAVPGVYNNTPFFVGGTYWSINDFNEPASWLNPNAMPSPGSADRDYKRSISLATGKVDSPVYSKDMRLGAWCVVDRNPEVIEKKFISVTEFAIPNGYGSTGGTLKTKYNRACPPQPGDPGCEAIGATSCDGGYCVKTETVSFSSMAVYCNPQLSENLPLSTATYHIENNSCVVDKTGVSCPGTGAVQTWKGNDYNGFKICYFENCPANQHLDPDTLLCVDNAQACFQLNGACKYSNHLCDAATPCSQDCVSGRCQYSGEVCSTDNPCDNEDCINWTVTSVKDWEPGTKTWSNCHATACNYQATPGATCTCSTNIVNGVCTSCTALDHLEGNPPLCVSNCQGGSYSSNATCDASKKCTAGQNIGNTCATDADCPICVSTAGDCSIKRCQNSYTSGLLSETCTDNSNCVNTCQGNGYCSLMPGRFCDVNNPCPASTCVTTDNRKMIWQGDLQTGSYQCIFQSCASGFHVETSGSCQPDKVYDCSVADWVKNSEIAWSSASGWGQCNATACYDYAVLAGTTPNTCMCLTSGAASNPIIRNDACTYCGNGIKDVSKGEQCDTGLDPVTPVYDRTVDLVFLFDTSASMAAPQATICNETKSVISYLLNEAHYHITTAIACTASNPDCDNAAGYMETGYPCTDSNNCTFLQKTDGAIKCELTSNTADNPTAKACYVQPPTYCPNCPSNTTLIECNGTAGCSWTGTSCIKSGTTFCKVDQPYFSQMETDVFSLPNGTADPVCSTGKLIVSAAANPNIFSTVPVPTLSCNTASDCYGVYKSTSGVACASLATPSTCVAPNKCCALVNSCPYNTTDETDDAVCLPKYDRSSLCANSSTCEIANGAFYPNCSYYDNAIDCGKAYNCKWTTSCVDDPFVTPPTPRILAGTTLEDWGEGIIDILNNRRWLDGQVKIIVPVSDEGPQDGSGNNVTDGPIGIWDQGDFNILFGAGGVVQLAQAKGVKISPVYTWDNFSPHIDIDQPMTSIAGSPTIRQMVTNLANQTGGTAYFTKDNVGNNLKDMIKTAGTLCEDVTGDGKMDCVYP